jgi:acyl carrier protein
MTGEPDPLILARVVASLRRILRDPDVSLEPDTRLERVRGFDSHALYQLIAELENECGVELEPEFVVPETFATPATVAQAFARPRLPSHT